MVCEPVAVTQKILTRTEASCQNERLVHLPYQRPSDVASYLLIFSVGFIRMLVSGVTQLALDKPAGAHFLQSLSHEAAGSINFSSLIWQKGPESRSSQTVVPYTSSFEVLSVTCSVIFQDVLVAIAIQAELFFA